MNEKPAGQEGRPPAGGARWMGYLLLVLAYVATGKLGLALALPGGYASPIFPPAGIAVAAALIAGRGAFPWVFLGALLLNLWTGYSANHEVGLTGIVAAFIIAVASTVQAALGGGWLRRLIGYPTALDNGPDLARFLLSAPVICLASATLSVAGLWAIGVTATDRLAASWAAWWVGDTLGVLVMLPVTLVVVGKPRPLWRSRVRTVAVPTGLAFALLALVFVEVSRWERENSLLEFRLLSQQVDSQIEAKFEEQASLLEQLDGLFRVTPRVTREQFHRFVEKSLKRFPMITAVEWAPRVEGLQRAAFEEAQRREIPGFQIRERDAAGRLRRAGNRARYYPLTFVEPLAGNAAGLGFDLASGTRRRPALERAIRSGAIVATSPVRLAQATGLERTGVLLLSAVKEGGDVRGFVLTALEMHAFMEKLLSTAKPSIYLRLDDLDEHATLYDSFPPGSVGNAINQRTLVYGERHYRLLTAPTPAYLARHQGFVGWGVLVAGLLGTGLLGGMLLLGTGHTARVEAQVVDRTRRLTESEAKLREITSTLGEGVYVMDETGLVTFVNPEAQRLLGLTEQEMLGRNAHNLFHHHRPDRAPSPEEECGIGRVRHLGETYRSEDEMFWRKDGSAFPVEVWSSAIVREGRAAGAVVAFTDITRRKQAEEAVRKAAQEVEDLYNNAPCGYHSLDEDGVFVRINDTELKWLGYRRGEVIGKMRFPDVLTPASQQHFQENFPGFKARGYVHDLDFEMVRKDGTVFAALLSATAVREGDGHYLMSRSTVFDITARKQMEKALRESEERFRNTLEYAPIGVAVVSLGGQFLQVNRALCDILGYARHEMEQLYFQDITHPDDLALDLSNVKRLLAGEIDSYQIEKRYIRKDGQAVWTQLTGTVLRDARGEPLSLIAQVEDITERRRAQEQIRQLAYYDTLTGLPNRRLLVDRLQHDLDQARRFRRSLAIMFLDLDRFKQINDTLGHDVGDELLKVVAARLSACVRSGDTVSRQGGDEFVIVLAEIAHAQDAARVAEKAIESLGEPIVVLQHELHITASIGIAVYPDSGTDDMQELMKKADQAMYAAKEGGRNMYRFYPPEAI